MSFWKLPEAYINTYIYKPMPFLDLVNLYLATPVSYTKSLIQMLCALLEKGETEEELDVITLCLARIVQYSNESPEGAQRWCPKAIAKLMPYIQASLNCSNITLQHKLIVDLFQREKINPLKLTLNSWDELPSPLSGLNYSYLLKRAIILFIAGDEETRRNIHEINKAIELPNSETLDALIHKPNSTFHERLKTFTEAWPFLQPLSLQKIASSVLPDSDIEDSHVMIAGSIELQDEILDSLVLKLEKGKGGFLEIDNIIAEILNKVLRGSISQKSMDKVLKVLISKLQCIGTSKQNIMNSLSSILIADSDVIFETERQTILDALIEQLEKGPDEKIIVNALPFILNESAEISSDNRKKILTALVSILNNSNNIDLQKNVANTLCNIFDASVAIPQVLGSLTILPDKWELILNSCISEWERLTSLGEDMDMDMEAQAYSGRLNAFIAICPNVWESIFRALLSRLTEGDIYVSPVSAKNLGNIFSDPGAIPQVAQKTIFVLNALISKLNDLSALVLNSLEDNNARTLGVVAEALGKIYCTSGAISQTEQEIVLDIFLLKLNDHENRWAQAAAIKTLSKILSTSDRLPQKKREEILDSLVSKLNDNKTCITSIIQALGNILSAPVQIFPDQKRGVIINRLILILPNDQENNRDTFDVQYEVVEALDQILSAPVLSLEQRNAVLNVFLSTLESDADPDLKRPMAKALVRICSTPEDIFSEERDRILKTLISQCSHVEDETQKIAVDALGQILSASVQTPPKILEMVLETLISRLSYNFGDTYGELQKMMAEVLGKVLNMMPETEQEARLNVLVLILNNNENPYVQQEVAYAVGCILKTKPKTTILEAMRADALEALISQLGGKERVCLSVTSTNQNIAAKALSKILSVSEITALIPSETQEAIINKLFLLISNPGLTIVQFRIIEALGKILSLPFLAEESRSKTQDKIVDKLFSLLPWNKQQFPTYACNTLIASINALGNILSAPMVKISIKNRQLIQERLLFLMMHPDLNNKIRQFSEAVVIKIFDAMLTPIKKPHSQDGHWMIHTRDQKKNTIKKLVKLNLDLGRVYLHKLILWDKDTTVSLLSEIKQEISSIKPCGNNAEYAEKTDLKNIQKLECIISILDDNRRQLKRSAEVELDTFSRNKQARY